MAFAGYGNQNAHERYRTNHEAAVALLKSKSLFLSKSKICKQKHLSRRVHTTIKNT